MKKIFTILFLVILCTSCEELNVPEDKRGDEWGLKSIELAHIINLENNSYNIEINFKARITSKKYCFAFMFPKINENIDVFSISEDINKQFDGLKLELLDVLTNKKIVSIYYKYKPKTKGIFYYIPKNSLIAGIYMENMNLIEGRDYKILIQIPSKKRVDKKVQNIILGLGIEPTIMFL